MAKTEEQFCEENDLVKNEHGAYAYVSKDGSSHINLAAILEDYKEWLIEKRIVSSRSSS
jgi:hypothetical protein